MPKTKTAQSLPSTKPAPSIYTLKITLMGVEPPIWRRVQVPSTIPLSRLHDVFQIAMGWTNSHLHQFEKDGRIWADPESDMNGEFDLIDESTTPLEIVLEAEGDSLVYVYDFGDDWRHEVVVEKIESTDDLKPRLVCIAGERRCPPEDVGGPPGYMDFLEVLFDPAHEEFKHLAVWAGGPFHAEEFDFKKVNAKLSRMRWAGRGRG